MAGPSAYSVLFGEPLDQDEYDRAYAGRFRRGRTNAYDQLFGETFDPRGEGYDYTSAGRFGIRPDRTGHWQSRVELPETERRMLGLPEGSALILKGRNHETFPLTVKGERDAGYRIIEYRGRLYSVPVDEPR